jgi:transcription antitermination factor NusG
MQKHWYILYTKAKCEKKVAGLLTRKKIENFYPVHRKQINEPRRVKQICEPLFSSYIFVYIDKSEINRLKQLNNVINLVYWKGTPATVSENEMNSIKNFSDSYQNIKLIRSKVAENKEITVNRSSYLMEGNILVVKNKIRKVNLPSLGFTMTVEIEDENVIGREVEFGKRDLVLQ